MSVSEKAIEPGSILRASWGWEQTNVDFYAVIRTTKTSAIIRRIADRPESDGKMTLTGTKTPCPGEFTGPEIRRKIRGDGLFISDYEWARVWDGRPVGYSEYA